MTALIGSAWLLLRGVRAGQNGESPSEWSAAGTGRTSIGNSEPTFDDRTSLDRASTDPTTTRTVAENTRAGQSVGRAVRAVDGNGDRRPTGWSLHLDRPTRTRGQVRHQRVDRADSDQGTPESRGGVYCDDSSLTGGHPENCTYTVKVQVWDGLDGTGTRGYLQPRRRRRRRRHRHHRRRDHGEYHGERRGRETGRADGDGDVAPLRTARPW